MALHFNSNSSSDGLGDRNSGKLRMYRPRKYMALIPSITEMATGAMDDRPNDTVSVHGRSEYHSLSLGDFTPITPSKLRSKSPIPQMTRSKGTTGSTSNQSSSLLSSSCASSASSTHPNPVDYSRMKSAMSSSTPCALSMATDPLIVHIQSSVPSIQWPPAPSPSPTPSQELINEIMKGPWPTPPPSISSNSDTDSESSSDSDGQEFGRSAVCSLALHKLSGNDSDYDVERIV